MEHKIGFILDLDGTLVNSTEITDTIQAEVMKKFDIEISEERERELEEMAESMFQENYSTWLALKIMIKLMKEVGMSFSQRIKALILAGKMYKKKVNNITLFPGVEELIGFFEKNSYKYAIVTSSSRKMVERYAENFPEFYKKLAEKIITKDDVEHLKPDPESIDKATAIMDIPPNRIAVVGDTKYDILFGKSMNLVTIGVLSGMYSEEILRNYEPDFIFSSVSEIPANIENIIQLIEKRDN